MLLALLLLGQAPATPEDVNAPTPQGFVSAFNAAQGGMRIEERIPRGETVEQWTRMITIQRLGGIAHIGGTAFLNRLSTMMAQSCAGASATAADAQSKIATIRVDCPLNNLTGKPETMFARAFTGSSDVFVVQYAFRSVPTSAQVAEAEAYLASVVSCGGAGPACPKSN